MTQGAPPNEENANHPVFDGTFMSGPLEGATVDMKWRGGGSRSVNMTNPFTAFTDLA